VRLGQGILYRPLDVLLVPFSEIVESLRDDDLVLLIIPGLENFLLLLAKASAVKHRVIFEGRECTVFID